MYFLFFFFFLPSVSHWKKLLFGYQNILPAAENPHLQYYPLGKTLVVTWTRENAFTFTSFAVLAIYTGDVAMWLQLRWAKAYKQDWVSRERNFMNLKKVLVFLIISSSPIKAVISPNSHLDEKDARIINFLLSMRNVLCLVTSRAWQGALLGGS